MLYSYCVGTKYWGEPQLYFTREYFSAFLFCYSFECLNRPYTIARSSAMHCCCMPYKVRFCPIMKRLQDDGDWDDTNIVHLGFLLIGPYYLTNSIICLLGFSIYSIGISILIYSSIWTELFPIKKTSKYYHTLSFY